MGMNSQPASRRDLTSLAAISGFGVALVCAVPGLLAGFGTRLGWWDYRTGFFILSCAVWLALAAAGVSVAALAIGLRHRRHRPIGFAILGSIIGALVFGVPWYLVHEGRKLPPIHDITTDTDDPPAFAAVLALRNDAPNTAQYGGPELAAQQKQGYPDLAPLLLPVPAREAFNRALDAAWQSGWDIVAAEPEENRIEATATTAWFGFKDDVVIRIRPAGNGSRVDVRSVSRVGRSDLGTNAQRIRIFLKRLAGTKS